MGLVEIQIFYKVIAIYQCLFNCRENLFYQWENQWKNFIKIKVEHTLIKNQKIIRLFWSNSKSKVVNIELSRDNSQSKKKINSSNKLSPIRKKN